MVKDTKLYDLLEVSPSATQTELKKSFLKLSMKWHPDKNPGNPEAEKKYKQITAAYDILKDPEKREAYDRYGEEGLSGGAGGVDISDIFGGMFDIFNGGRSARNKSPPPKGPDVEYKLVITLEEAYLGCKKTVTVTRQEMCEACSGVGATKPDALKTCSTCGGNGVVVQVQRMGNMISQTQRPCPTCNGKGQTIQKEFLCQKCGGKKVSQKAFTTTVDVSPGVPNGYVISQYGDGHWSPGCSERGDLLIRVIIREHERFKRFSDDGCDLLMERSISLVEALCGFALVVKHLDGRMLTLVCQPNISKDGANTVISPYNSKRIIENEGMPVFGRNWVKGDLVVQFSIEFPTKITVPVKTAVSALSSCIPINSGARSRIERALEFSDESKINSSNNTFALVSFDEKKRREREKSKVEAAKSDSGPSSARGGGYRGGYDEEMGGPQAVQCGTQ